MIERPLLRDLALIAVAAALGWWAHSVDNTVRTAIARAYDADLAVQFDGGTSLHGSVVLTAHSIRISLRSGERTA